MKIRPRAIVALTCVAAVVVFCVVQDRGTVDGVRDYVVRQEAALAGDGAIVTIDGILVPAVERSVRKALTWSGLVLAAGLAAAAIRRRD